VNPIAFDLVGDGGFLVRGTLAISARWWVQIAFAAFFWLLAFSAIRLGAESLKWCRQNQPPQSN
jgi:hypothetical protein